MQVPPSASLFQALSALMQPQGPQQVQGAAQGTAGTGRPVDPGQGPAAAAPGGTATTPGAGGASRAAPAETRQAAGPIAIPEPPEPGIPVRRGMLVDLSV